MPFMRGNRNMGTLQPVNCAIALALLIFGCNRGESPSGGDDGWLRGSDAEKFRLVEKHFRGFDMAMVETGYRYNELYWAGYDKNWEYAGYQVEKIRTAVANGVERRPLRAESARMLYPALDALEETIKAEDPVLFRTQFTLLTQICNACHLAENVSFIGVSPPRHRLSPVDNPPANTAGENGNE